MINPCKNCVPPQRYVGCHSQCELYFTWRSLYDKEKEERTKEKKQNNKVNEYFIDRQRKYNK